MSSADMSNELKIKFINEEEFANMSSGWNGLLEKSSNNSVFMRHEWVYSWWKTFGKEASLFAFSLHDEHGSLLAIAPLCIKKNRFFNSLSLRTMSFLGAELVEPDYLGFIIKADYEQIAIEKIMEFLLTHHSKWDILWLEDMLAANPQVRIIAEKINRLKGIFLHTDDGICPIIRLPGNFQDYLKDLSSKRRKTLRSNLSRAKKSYKYEFGEAKTEQEATELMDALFELHKARADSINLKSTLRSNLVKKFHLELIPSLFPQGYLKLFYTKLNGNLEGCLYGFVYNGSFYAYQHGFNPYFEKYSLGTSMFFNTVDYAIQIGCNKYDFLKGNEAYKFNWANDTMTTATLLICPFKIKPFVFYLYIKLRRMMGACKKKLNFKI